MSETKRIVVLAGDGIGPEIVGATRQVLDAVGDFEYTEHLIGGASIDEHGVALTDEVIAACKDSDAVLLGAVGGPKWDEAVANDPTAPRPEQGLLGIRKALGLYANLRPVKPSPALIDASPLKKELIDGTDLLVVRELTGGIYFGASGRREENGGTAYDECAYSVPEIQRITRAAFEAARQRSDSPRVLSVDKANVLETSRLWRETVKEVAEEYPDVQLDHLLVDFAAMKLVSAPAEIDVIVTENLFGDILSDEAAMLTGSLGMLPSASIGAEGEPGLFEPVHGSAPDIAGQGVANPLATMLSAAMMLRYGLGDGAAADRIETAVDAVLAKGMRTPDIYEGGAGETRVGTEEVTAAVLAELG
ncbi:MAG: 3-isopropylmalate dehydrogenase [Solirubrobacterales bacterium]|nr:3-isopropylmalate dehydrogenase [Solirubrobacterales bacterium]OJU94041.1 MAG: 3-isopropylmalate dehydrogenase [Solirubrobacterales bacterium 67-14]